MFWWETVKISKKARLPFMPFNAHSHRVPTPHIPSVCAPQLFLVGVCVLIRPGSTVQLVIGFAFSLMITLFSSTAEPFQNHGHD
eukprot:scaffold6273_cov105-Phaeocystis_antarctica.AAC.1